MNAVEFTGQNPRRETRFGVLIPSTNSILERDAHVFLPHNVSAHFSRMRYDPSGAEPLVEMRRHAEQAASLLADSEMDVVAYGCTAGSLLTGLSYDVELARALYGITGVSTITTASSVIDALRASGASRVSVVTPYSDQVDRMLIAYLEEQDIKVVSIGGFDGIEPREIPLIQPEAIVQAVLETEYDASEAIFLSCTAMRGMECIETVRNATGKPVVTSNQATFRKMFLETGDAQLERYVQDSGIFSIPTKG